MIPSSVDIIQITSILKMIGVETNRDFAVTLSALVYDRVLVRNKYRSQEDVSELGVDFSVKLINTIEEFLNEMDSPPEGFFQKPLDNNSQE
jgi:hypothetical protein